MPLKPKTHSPLPPFLQQRVQRQREVDSDRRKREYETGQQRKEDKAFYCSTRWKKFRLWFLAQPENALCVECKDKGLVVPATQLDHIKPRKEYPELTWELSNLQGLCRECHGAKTARGE